MAKTSGSPEIGLKVLIELDEEEALALDALMGYGVDSFLKVFYEHLGQAYLKQYENGLRRLFDTARPQLSFILKSTKSARKQLDDVIKNKTAS